MPKESIGHTIAVFGYAWNKVISFDFLLEENIIDTNDLAMISFVNNTEETRKKAIT